MGVIGSQPFEALRDERYSGHDIIVSPKMWYILLDIEGQCHKNAGKTVSQKISTSFQFRHMWPDIAVSTNNTYD